MSELVIDEALVRSLLEEQCPDLASLPLKPFQGGWDNQMWRLGEDLAVRLPMTPRAPELLENEHRWLPVLAPRLPLPVPMPLHLGQPTGHFPRTWIVTTWIAGTPVDATPISRGQPAAESLAAFLTALHQEAPFDAPHNPGRTAPLAEFKDGVDHRLTDLVTPEQVSPLHEIWVDALKAEAWNQPPVWLHGDLHPANALAAEGTLNGIIDFGDMCAGDPATDLCAAWMLLPEDAVAQCLRTYPWADKETVRRARGWALLRALELITIGRAGELGLPGGKPTWKPAGEATIERLLATS